MIGLMQGIKMWFVRVLRRAEGVTRTDNVYLAKNAWYLNFTQGISILTGAVLFFVAARVLPKELYGEYKYYLSLFGLFGVATFTGMETALARAVANGFEGSLPVAFRRKLLGGLVGAAGAVAAALYYFSQQRADLALALLLLAAFGPPIYAATVYGGFYTGARRFDVYSRIATGVQLVAFAGTLAAFLLLHTAEMLFLVFLATSAANLVAYVLARRAQRNAAADPDLLPFANHLSALDVLATIAVSLDGVLIFQFLGAAPLAVYAVAIAPVEQLKGLLKSASGVAFPKFSAADFPTLRAGLPRKLLLYGVIVGVVTLLYVLCVPFLFRWFFPNYVDATVYSQAYALSLVAVMPANVLLTVFQARGWRRETAWFNVVSYGAQIVFLIVGAYVYGLWGAIAARLVGRVLMAATGAILFFTARDQARSSQ